VAQDAKNAQIDILAIVALIKQIPIFQVINASAMIVIVIST